MVQARHVTLLSFAHPPFLSAAARHLRSSFSYTFLLFFIIIISLSLFLSHLLSPTDAAALPWKAIKQGLALALCLQINEWMRLWGGWGGGSVNERMTHTHTHKLWRHTEAKHTFGPVYPLTWTTLPLVNGTLPTTITTTTILDSVCVLVGKICLDNVEWEQNADHKKHCKEIGRDVPAKQFTAEIIKIKWKGNYGSCLLNCLA